MSDGGEQSVPNKRETILTQLTRSDNRVRSSDGSKRRILRIVEISPRRPSGPGADSATPASAEAGLKDSKPSKIRLLLYALQGYFVFFALKIRHRVVLLEIGSLASHLIEHIAPSLREAQQRFLTLEIVEDGTENAVCGRAEETRFLFPGTSNLAALMKGRDLDRIKLDTSLEYSQLIEIFLMLIHVDAPSTVPVAGSNPYTGWRPKKIAAEMLSGSGFHRFCTVMRLRPSAREYTVEYSYCEPFFSAMVQRYVRRNPKYDDHERLFKAAPKLALVTFLFCMLPLFLLQAHAAAAAVIWIFLSGVIAAALGFGMRTIGSMQSVREHRDKLIGEYLREISILSRFPESNPNPQIKLSLNGDVLYANPATQRLLEKLGIGQDAVAEILPPDVKKMLAECLVNKEAIHESESRTRGKVVRFRFSAFPDEQSFIASGSDVTYLKNIESELREANLNLEEVVSGQVVRLEAALESLHREEEQRKKTESMLRQSQKMEAIGRLAGGIAHDFNNILQAQLMYTEIAREKLSADTRFSELIRPIEESCHRAKDLVQQIMTFSRKAESKKDIVQVDGIVEEALGLLRGSLPSTIEIRSRLSSGAAEILGDASQIHQIVMNLCINARHAIGGERGVITVSTDTVEAGAGTCRALANLERGTYLQLRVSDTGEGMDEETLTRIFEPFYTTKEVGEGTGLGLSVVHGIVRDHDGDMTVESKPGCGATFSLYFQLAPEGAQKVPEAKPERIRGRERILFVDDEEHIAQAVTGVLEDAGYTLTARTDATEALEEFRLHPDMFDIVITDHTMPKITGIQLSKRIVAIRRDIPILLMTGSGEVIAEAQAHEPQVTDCLLKPATGEELVEAIRRTLQRAV